jgi:hypothetical protein
MARQGCIRVFFCLYILCTEYLPIAIVDSKLVLYIFTVMENKRMGRPPKPANERKTAAMLIPMTDAEREQIRTAAEADEAKPVTWARDVLLRAAKRRAGK